MSLSISFPDMRSSHFKQAHRKLRVFSAAAEAEAACVGKESCTFVSARAAAFEWPNLCVRPERSSRGEGCNAANALPLRFKTPPQTPKCGLVNPEGGEGKNCQLVGGGALLPDPCNMVPKHLSIAIECAAAATSTLAGAIPPPGGGGSPEEVVTSSWQAIDSYIISDGKHTRNSRRVRIF